MDENQGFSKAFMAVQGIPPWRFLETKGLTRGVNHYFLPFSGLLSHSIYFLVAPPKGRKEKEKEEKRKKGKEEGKTERKKRRKEKKEQKRTKERKKDR